jgi:hypothetical protein
MSDVTGEIVDPAGSAVETELPVETVEQPVVVEPVEGEVAAPVEPSAEPVDKVKVRFSEITKERDAERQARQESDRNLRIALEALERAAPKPVPVVEKPVVEDVAPTPPAFEDPEQYQRDMAVYTQQVTERAVKLGLKQAQEAGAQEAAQRAATQQQAKVITDYQTRRQQLMLEAPDFTEVAENPALHVTTTMASAIALDDKGPQLLYHLGKNPELADKIAQMSPHQQLVELGVLKATALAPKAPRVSQAPPPIKPLTGNGSAATRSDEELSMEEYAAKRNGSRKT